MAGNLKMLTYVSYDEREEDKKPLSLRLVVRLLSFTRPYRPRMVKLVALVLLRSLQLPLMAWAVGAVFGGPISRLDVPGVLWGAAGYGVLVLFTNWTMYYRVRFALELGEQTIHDLRNRMFEHLQTQSMRFYNRTKLGRIISRFTSDAEAVRVGIQDVLFVTLVQAGQMIAAAAFMIYYDWVLFLVVLGMAPFLTVINRYFTVRLSHAYRASQESFSRITATLAESVQGIRVTQGFAREKENAAVFSDLVADHARYNLDAGRMAGIYFPLLELNSQTFVGLVLLVGGWQVFTGRVEVAALYQFLMMTGFFFAPIQGIGNQYNAALTSMAGAERVFNLLDSKPDVIDTETATDLPDIKGKVEFDKVWFEYDAGKAVLRDVSFVAEPGQTIALVGHTGSGKSSIINLLSKFYLPTQGRVLIDGRDLNTIRSESLHAQMGLVLQQNFLFTGTVMENIRAGRANATDADVFAAVDALNCRDLIDELPEGIQTRVGERGTGVSLGQRQLICFARAMLTNPAILILDEATSAVDTLTEMRIQQALEKLLKDRTSFVIAHRLSTIRHADAVLVLERGQIIERGTHVELLRQAGTYAALYREFVKSGSAQV